LKELNLIGARELEVFLAAAEHENFSLAARKLHMSQPSISFQIQSLEQQLNVQLFQRIGHRIQLTQAGRDLLPIANEMMNLSCQIEELVDAKQSVVTGSLTLGCTTSPGRYILPILLGAFRERFPGVQSFVEVSPDRSAMEEKLLAKEAHFAIFGLPPKNKKLEVWPIFQDELVLIVSTRHPWANREQVSPEELKEADWVMREPRAATRQLALAALAEQGIDAEDLKVVMQLGCPESVVVAVENECGVSIVSRVAIQRSLKLGRIKTIPVENVSITRQILMARNPNGACTRVQLCFRDFIESGEGQQVISAILGQSPALPEKIALPVQADSELNN
jgi:LysR family transcriptional regulator, low CO2-responsive transcriptional regulator